MCVFLCGCHVCCFRVCGMCGKCLIESGKVMDIVNGDSVVLGQVAPLLFHAPKFCRHVMPVILSLCLLCHVALSPSAPFLTAMDTLQAEISSRDLKFANDGIASECASLFAVCPPAARDFSRSVPLSRYPPPL